MADHLDEVFGGPEAEAMEAAEQVIENQPIEQPENVEAQPEHERQAEQPVAPPAEEKREDQIPLAKYLDQRDELKEMRRRVAEYEAKQVAPKQAIPDALDDPDGFVAYQQRMVHEAVTNQKFQMSELMAKQSHGEETVTKASEWALEKANTDPAFAAAYHRQAHPIDWIVQQHKRESLYSQLPTDVSSLDELIEREIAKRSASVVAAAPAVVAQQQASPPVKVPRSLATQGSGPSDIRQVATGPLAGVDAIFS